MKTPYTPMRSFRRAALAQAGLWPVVKIIVLMELVFVLGPVLVMLMLPPKALAIYETGTTPVGVIAQLSTFALYALALVYLVRRLHGRGFWSMVGPVGAAATNLKLAGLAVGALLLVQAFLPPWIALQDLAEIRPLIPWLAWLPVTIAVLVIQTGTEELYFRGYLQQQFSVISDKPWVWMGLPSLLFGVGHYMNGNGAADGVIYVFWATLLGLACADLTARTGNIGAAVGLHLSNNLFAFVVVGVQDWPSSGLALFLYPFEDPSQYDYALATLLEPWVLIELPILSLSVAVMWLAARIAIRA
uniref:lysostaphin resistance A-like protein n=1 Tax=Yoonia sp. TaxID=2212373 RepID=UPI0040474CE7